MQRRTQGVCLRANVTGGSNLITFLNVLCILDQRLGQLNYSERLKGFFPGHNTFPLKIVKSVVQKSADRFW